MIVTRRGFLQSCLALAAAPAIVRADSLMRVVPRDALVVRLGPAFDQDFMDIVIQAFRDHHIEQQNWFRAMRQKPNFPQELR